MQSSKFGANLHTNLVWIKCQLYCQNAAFGVKMAPKQSKPTFLMIVPEWGADQK